MSRPVVLHVVVAGEIGGAERVLVDLASGPEETGTEHAIALFSPNKTLAEMLRGAGLAVTDRGFVREGPAHFLARSLAHGDLGWLIDVARRRRAKVLHLHTFASQVLGTRAALREGLPVVRTEHSTRVYDDPSCWPFSRWSLRNVDYAVAISRHVEVVALRKAPWAREKMSIVYNGVDTDRLAPQPLPTSGPFRFAMVGRLEPRKGVDRAIDAVAEVEGAELDVIGEGEDRPRLEAYARRRGVASRVRFHGFVADPSPIVGECDAALSGSRKEGLGIALLEAMAQGRPVVGFPTGGIPEFVTPMTGWLAKGNDARALSVAMRAAMDSRDEVKARGGASRVVVEARFSLHAMRAGYAAVYKKVIQSRSPSSPG